MINLYNGYEAKKTSFAALDVGGYVLRVLNADVVKKPATEWLVISFDISEVLLETELGMLHVKGKDLHVNRLNLEKGEVDIEGMIEGFSYSAVPIGIKKGDSFLGKLFSK